MRDDNLTAAQWADCAALAGSPVDIFKALCLVESRQNAFLPSGFPTCLYEPHVVWRNATKAERKILEPLGLAYPRQGEKPYGTFSEQQTKFYACAAKTCFDLAVLGTSFGLLQILGENWKACAFSSSHAFFQAMTISAYSQIHTGALLMRAWGMGDALRHYDFPAIARRWNGAGNVDAYAVKLQAALQAEDSGAAAIIKSSRDADDRIAPASTPQAPEGLFWRLINFIANLIFR